MQTGGLIKFAGVTCSSAPPTIAAFDRDAPTKPSHNLIVCPLSPSIFCTFIAMAVGIYLRYCVQDLFPPFARMQLKVSNNGTLLISSPSNIHGG